MHISFLLFLAATALVASVNTLHIEADTEATSLRSIKTAVDDGVAEKRGGFYYKFDFNLLDNIFHSLSERFQRMRKEPEHLRTIFACWKSGIETSNEAVQFMRLQGLSDKAITQFKAAYKAYLLHHG
ncbi:hypothetical protein JG687_00014137 [Phytophthora cactorum]|uniref:RxLR effector protein n=1 Tax=Phytophthora cactorum TaxID=29920 RepID=A0A329SSA1_9STRA|nr:hypothetical protein Pcac1_g26195 [Phytophthora cactorum]KAG2805500.1 hypothetical protein PC111_g17786 [Phytophthora cactorum]KAG2808149.1 hypothetical protein PC112_g17096 [Phytophthora cactorum]KAG2850011.1 hypothetical protein PC113_g17178 [Phytophthora cactorum]KAG2887690.1 hypothetical protein PC114_g18725 [Phytophthora cactorum]